PPCSGRSRIGERQCYIAPASNPDSSSKLYQSIVKPAPFCPLQTAYSPCCSMPASNPSVDRSPVITPPPPTPRFASLAQWNRGHTEPLENAAAARVHEAAPGGHSRDRNSNMHLPD